MMSRSILHCPTCKSAAAVKHHSGRIQVELGVRVVILTSGEVELWCECGARRLVHDDYGGSSVHIRPCETGG